MSNKNIAHTPTHDPSALTPLEVKIHEMREKGMKHREIAEHLGGKWSEKNIGAKLLIIREKLACQ